MNLYPLLMSPHFRHGLETPWGGSMLRDVFLKDAPDVTGESLEVSTLPGRESLVANGEHAGKPLSRMVDLWGEALTGLSGEPFPLLLKLLDTQQALSVQVHPGDEYAAAHENKPGKTEAWIVLNAEPDSKIVYGLDLKGQDLSALMAEGRVEEGLLWVSVRPGDVYYIPHGMVHALGAGIQVYEIQQPSDVTYRLYDWNRLNRDGQPRELHPRQALEVARPELALHKIDGTTALCKGGSRTYYISDNNFELCRLNLHGRMPLESGRMLLLTPVGPCTLRWGDESIELNAFDTAVVPAALEGVALEGSAKVLMSSLPHREALIQELGYRAENVAGLVE